MTDFEHVKVRLIPLPAAVDIGGGWVRRRVALEFSRPPDLDRFEPPEPGSLRPTTPIVLVRPESPTVYQLTMDSRDPVSGDDIAYLSLVVQRLAMTTRASVVIDGYERHPLLYVARSPQEESDGKPNPE